MARYFQPAEFACKCCGQNGIDPQLVDMLDELRDQCGFPLVISSGYRCTKRNQAVGGARSSAHVEGYAVDIRCHGLRAHRVLEVAMLMGFPGIGVKQTGAIENRFIHLDIATNDATRSRPSVWSY